MQLTPLAVYLSKRFGLGKQAASIKPIGNGLINCTLLLTSPNTSLVVQKLNTKVFPEPELLIKNARLIEQHLTLKQQANEYDLSIVRHVTTVENDYLVNAEQGVWRALEFIGNSYSEDVVGNSQQAHIAAGAFGQFARALADFDAEQLHPVIANFHNLAMRAEVFKKVLATASQQRLASCQAEVAFCLSQFTLIDELNAVTAVLPVRPCHNDTKINNMLFCKQTHKAKAVIDLDTCMPGFWLYDFGDMVRTFCSPEEEDSTQLDNVYVREDIFAAIVKGYVTPLQAVLSEQEKHSFWLGTKVMTFMVGLRFLTDYLDGDNYFAVKHSTHNLQRAQNQFTLYKDILAKQTRLTAILANS